MILNSGDFPDGSMMTDPVVYVHLMSGRLLGLENVSIIEVAKRMRKYGFVLMSDGEGDYAVLFEHGVAALTTGQPQS